MKEKRNATSQTIRECDVFISYRRDGGDMTAMYVYQALKERGYNVFYDLEVLRAGRFNEALLSSIESCTDFVLILSPGALDRCQEEDDWVRKEIAEALRTKKNIVPVMLKGFKFPEGLPEDIDDVRYQNGLTCTTEYFEESINRLCQRYLNALPASGKKKKVHVAVIAIATAVALAVSGFLALRGGKKPEVEIPAPTVEVTVGPTAQPTAEPTVIATVEPTAQPVQVVKDTGFPVLSTAIDYIDGNDNSGDDIEKSVQENSLVLNHPTLRRRDIASVSFLPSLAGAPQDAWDVSEAGDGQVLAWVTPNGDLFDLTIAGDGGVKILDSSNGNGKLFACYTNATAIRFNGCVDLSQRTILRDAFGDCDALEEIDFTGVSFDSVVDMSYMFANCQSLRALDTTGWQTSNNTSLDGTFMNCLVLEDLNLSGLDTSSVTQMQSTFLNCGSLARLDLSGFDTRRVTSIGDMFDGCVSLQSLDLSGFDTSRIVDMKGLFADCQSLKAVNLAGIDTGRVTDMDYMFANCAELETLDLHGFDTARVESMYGMFQGCANLDKLDVSGWDTGRVQDMAFMFEDCHALYSLDLSHFNTSAVTSMQCMFSRCDYAVELLLTDWDVSHVASMEGMFRNCASLESIGRDPAAFGHGDTTDMYSGCERLETA